MSEYVITILGRLKVYNDFKDVTMAHEDDTQVRQDHPRNCKVRPFKNFKVSPYKNCKVRPYNNCNV